MNPQSHICKFCKNPAKYEPISKIEKYGVTIFFCHTCHAEFLFWPTGSLINESLYAEINGKMYRLTTTPTIAVSIWYISEPGIPGKKINEGLKILKTFKGEIPDINPSNIVEKLKTYLIFI